MAQSTRKRNPGGPVGHPVRVTDEEILAVIPLNIPEYQKASKVGLCLSQWTTRRNRVEAATGLKSNLRDPDAA